MAQRSEDTTRHGAGHIIAITLGAILALVALGLTLAGIALIIGQAVMDEDGFVTSSSKELSTDSYALASPTFDVSGLDDWPLDDDPIRLRLTADGDTDMFIGVAPADAANDVLARIEHDVVDEDGNSDWFGGDVETVRRDGDAPSGAPEDLLDWAASARGSDDVTVTWEPTDGEWVVIAMNADGSAGLELDAQLGADVPFLQGFAWVMALSG
ncbi:MAG: exported protein of unknown function, partial [Thermoleophilia bacterium]|nr:exported protein of unknown function [Thermoleophilia bacterium]